MTLPTKMLAIAAMVGFAQGATTTTIVSTFYRGNTVTGSASEIALSQPSYTGTFTVTTATTAWSNPAFATAAPLPPCAEDMCTGSPTLNGQTCIDESGVKYGILCDQQVYGIGIQSSGKQRLLLDRERAVEEIEDAIETRDNAGSFSNCVDFCDNYYRPSLCTGVAYDHGYCIAYDTITGTYPHAGGIAAVVQA